jgi:hypothetical protein
MIKLTATREITPYRVHPDEERRVGFSQFYTGTTAAPARSLWKGITI